MSEIVKETVITEGAQANKVESAPVERKVSSFQTVQYLVYFFFGALDILLLFRLILKLFGANLLNNFVGLVYGITGIFIVFMFGGLLELVGL